MGVRTIYTDGGCHNTGPKKGLGAWAYVEVSDDITEVHCGRMDLTTNNRTEMYAVIAALADSEVNSDVVIISDSGYVVTGYTHPAYLDSWIRNAWHTASGGDVMNIDMWQDLIAQTYRVSVQFKHIRGHFKDPDITHAFWNAVVDAACTFIMQNDISGETILTFDPHTAEFKIKGIDVVAFRVKGLMKYDISNGCATHKAGTPQTNSRQD